MPRLSKPTVSNQPNCQTALNDKGGTVLGAAYSILCTDPNRITTLPALKAAWSGMSKAEQHQAKLFVEVNSKSVVKYKYWFITTYRNLDSGKYIKTVGCSQEGPGVPLIQIRQVVK